MAAGIGNTSEKRQYAGRITAFVVLSCITAAMGGVIFGYDIGISGGVSSMEPFLQKFFPEVYRRMKENTHISNYCKFDSQLLTAFTSSLYIAGLLTTFVSSWVTAKYGRRPSMLLGGAAFLAGATIGGAAVNVYMVIFGRVLLGVGLGFANQAVPLYLSEMAPPRYRGAFSNGFQFSVGVGVLSANLVNFGTEKIKGGWGWRVSLALAAVPAGFFTLGALFLPETPNSLIQQGKDHHKVYTLLQKIRGADAVEEELDDIIAANIFSRENSGLRTIIFQRNYRPQLAMAIMIPFFQQVTGINVIAFYAPVLLRTIGMAESASLMSAVVLGGIGAGSTLISMFAVDRFGRRTLFITGGVQMFVSQMLIGGIMAAQFRDHGALSKSYALILIFLIGVYKAGFGWSWGPLGWLVPSEIFPLEVRSAGQSITVAVNFLFTFFVAQSFLAMLCHMKAWIFFFYGGWLVVMTAFVVFLLPETKGLPIEQIVKVWTEHWFWKKFVPSKEPLNLNRSP